MTLLSAWLAIAAEWRSVFAQDRTHRRAMRQALGSLICLGRRCLTRILWTWGGDLSSWSVDYLLHSRSRWEPQQLFAPILRRGLEYCPGRLVGVALDDTHLRKTGRAIQQAFYQRDPMSPPFHVNLMLGLRFLQASLLIPLYRTSSTATRAVPIRFQEVSRVKRPRRKASPETWEQYRQTAKLHNLSRSFVDRAGQLRAELDAAGGGNQILVLAGDGSFCNRTCFGQVPERSVLLVRARKDAKLCFRAAEGSRRFYAVDKFTPEQVRKDEQRPWQTTKIFYGGKRRKVRYKEVAEVYWQRGAKQRALRLIVVAPTAYRKSKNRKLSYREPAYLFTTDLRSSARQLLQIYFDRWQIEVNHREEKDTLGVGEAQLWNVTSVPKQPVLSVAAYSALLLASLQAFDAERGEAYAALPKWRRHARRLDLVTLLRQEVSKQPDSLNGLDLTVTHQGLVRGAAAKNVQTLGRPP